MRKNFNENAFTGLEAAIVLIAFIVVAAVFSYVILGAGFFTTQKSQEVVHTGVSQASSSIEIVGNVYGVNNTTTDGGLGFIKFAVANTAGGTPIDVTQMVVVYIDENHRQEMTYTAGETEENLKIKDNWTILEFYNNVTANTLLEPGEQFVLGIHVEDPAPNQQFSVNLQPAAGAVYPIKRTVPPAINKINILL
ncbi:flagellin [Methanoculleus sp. Afa-1]|uniref:Flagellin n=1 Tax=Methanoculleus formosensis TaxID=2590886 RepID=A0A9E5DD04_9EURY|nr:archaellin/type IV pilin N-terminal domain-containing protein [Methanoculleus sp. Afa-1]MCT8337887.1 flagellin [Methanoculleus sp. Afa-1]